MFSRFICLRTPHMYHVRILKLHITANNLSSFLALRYLVRVTRVHTPSEMTWQIRDNAIKNDAVDPAVIRICLERL